MDAPGVSGAGVGREFSMCLAAGETGACGTGFAGSQKAKRESLGFPVGVVLTSILSVAAKGALPCSSVYIACLQSAPVCSQSFRLLFSVIVFLYCVSFTVVIIIFVFLLANISFYCLSLLLFFLFLLFIVVKSGTFFIVCCCYSLNLEHFLCQVLFIQYNQ